VVFTSIAFAVFALLVIPLYYLLDHKRQNLMLLVASYVFYGWWDYRFLFLLWLSTIVDYFVARRMNAQEGAARKRLMWISVGLNLVYLGFFKYFNFFVDSAATALRTIGFAPHTTFLQIALPVGISFYTFQSISYIVDVYRNSREHTDDFVSFALYLAYFPHLVAGPIQRSTQLLPQILAPRKVSQEQIESGAVLILIGYVKKVAIADAVAPAVNAAFAIPAERSASALLVGVYLFAVQIYCDFSGYTDIARGVSRLMGIELRVNFRQPYLSADITDFWRRWHISLSDWLRDYLYISLGGNRVGRWKTYRNLMLTMLLGGLWHGASWTFVVWGGLHGLYLAAHKFLLGERKHVTTTPQNAFAWIRRVLSILATFHLVCLAWIFFRAPTFPVAWAYLRGIFTLQPGAVPSTWLFAALIYIPFLLLLDIPSVVRRDEQPIPRAWPAPLRGASYGLMVAICLWIGAPNGAPFIYFQF